MASRLDCIVSREQRALASDYGLLIVLGGFVAYLIAAFA